MNSKAYRTPTIFFLLAMAAFGLSLAQDGSPYFSTDQNSAGASHDNACTIIADLPQGIVQGLTVTDTLPRGLIYESSSLEVIGTEVSPFEKVSHPNDGSQPVTITWYFGRVDNTANQDVSLRFQSIVANVVSNKDGECLAANQVSTRFKDECGEVHTAFGETASLKLVEPDLKIAMSSRPDGGKAATYTVSVGHAAESHADAYGSDLSILLPAGIIYSPGSAEIVSDPPGGGGGGVLDDTNPRELQIHFDEIERRWNEDNMILLEFQATTTAENVGDLSEIIATLGWKSTSEDNFGTRSYMTSQSIPVCIPASISSYSLNINQVAGPDPVEAGQTLLLAINYANTGKDDVHSVTIKEIYDRNVTYLSATPAADANKEDTWTIGDLLAGGSGTIKLEVRVNPDSSDGELLTNSVKLSCEEQAADEAITETIVKAKSDETATTNASINSIGNSINSTAINDSIELPQIPGNNTENSIPIENDTKLDPAPATNDLEIVTTFANLTSDAEPINDSSSLDLGLNDTKINPNADQFDALEEAREPTTAETPSQDIMFPFVADLADDAVGQTGTREISSEMESGNRDLNQRDPNTILDVSILSFSNGMKVDVIFSESSIGSDNAYIMSHEEDDGLSMSSSRTNGSDIVASLLNVTAISESIINQTHSKVNQTKSLETIPKIEVDETNPADNSKDLSNKEAVTTDIVATDIGANDIVGTDMPATIIVADTTATTPEQDKNSKPDRPVRNHKQA